MTLYVATSNPGKLRDFAFAAEAEARAKVQFAVEIKPLPGLAGIAAPPEEEPTFEGNARAKAMFYSLRAPGLLVLADDSGLEVACLNGAPGVRSARYAEDEGFPHPAASTQDERNNAALLRALDGVPEQGRRARYRCVLVVARDGVVLAVAEGSLDGSVLAAPRGGSGFGYDPIFLLPSSEKTMAEVDPPTRLEFSHRGRALRGLLQGPDREKLA